MEFTLDKLPPGVPVSAVSVPVPEWGEGMVAYIAELTADERDERMETWYPRRREAREQENNVGFRAYAVAATLCDAQRKFLAADEKAANDLADKLGPQNAVPVSRLFNKACELNGLLPEDVEELEKN